MALAFAKILRRYKNIKDGKSKLDKNEKIAIIPNNKFLISIEFFEIIKVILSF